MNIESNTEELKLCFGRNLLAGTQIYHYESNIEELKHSPPSTPPTTVKPKEESNIEELKCTITRVFPHVDTSHESNIEELK